MHLPSDLPHHHRGALEPSADGKAKTLLTQERQTLTDRDVFLSSFWRPYPELTVQATSRGRVLRKEGDGVLLSNGAVLQLHRWHPHFLRTEESRRASVGSAAPKLPSPRQVLQIHDIVAETSEGWILLSPCRHSEAWSHPSLRTSGYLREWSGFLSKVRGFFLKRDFVELSTPTLTLEPGSEAYLDWMSVPRPLKSEQQARAFLVSSPEISIKRVLAAQVELQKVFEIKSVFRQGELADHHEPEFTMLEWYRTYANHFAILADVRALFAELGQSSEFAVHSVASLWKLATGEVLLPTTDQRQMHAWCRQWGLTDDLQMSLEDAFSLVWVARVDPLLVELSAKAPVVVKDYPPFQAAYARVSAAGWAERFEVYWRGLEIANAYHELNDPDEQRRRLKRDQELRQSGDREVTRLNSLLLAQVVGLPPAAGIALGMERLFMALHGLDKVSQVRALSFSAQMAVPDFDVSQVPEFETFTPKPFI